MMRGHESPGEEAKPRRGPIHFATDGTLVRLRQPRVRRVTKIAQRAAHSESAGYKAATTPHTPFDLRCHKSNRLDIMN